MENIRPRLIFCTEGRFIATGFEIKGPLLITPEFRGRTVSLLGLSRDREWDGNFCADAIARVVRRIISIFRGRKLLSSTPESILRGPNDFVHLHRVSEGALTVCPLRDSPLVQKTMIQAHLSGGRPFLLRKSKIFPAVIHLFGTSLSYVHLSYKSSLKYNASLIYNGSCCSVKNNKNLSGRLAIAHLVSCLPLWGITCFLFFFEFFFL